MVNLNALSMPQNAADVQRMAMRVVINPVKRSSNKRYSKHEKTYHEHLLESGVNVDAPDLSLTRGYEQCPVVIACALILETCGPKELGFKELNARSSGVAVKSAVVNYWRKRGLSNDFSCLPDGAICGNPGKSQDLQSMIKSLETAQRESRINLTTRAYQETHEDVRAL